MLNAVGLKSKPLIFNKTYFFSRLEESPGMNECPLGRGKLGRNPPYYLEAWLVPLGQPTLRIIISTAARPVGCIPTTLLTSMNARIALDIRSLNHRIISNKGSSSQKSEAVPAVVAVSADLLFQLT